MMGIKVRSRKDPTMISRTAISRKIRLKYVKTLDFTISEVVLEGGSTDRLSQPLTMYSSTCRLVRPLSTSA